MKIPRPFSISIAAIIASASVTHAATIANGNFETPDLTTTTGETDGIKFLDGLQPADENFAGFAFVTGWTAANSGTGGGNSVYIGDQTNAGVYYPAATSGQQVIAFNNQIVGSTTSFTQTIATNIGDSYTVLFDLTRELGAPAAFTSLDLVATGGSSANYVTTDAFVQKSYSFTATSTSTALTFSHLGDGIGRSPVIDSVSIIPEPSAFALLGAVPIIGLLRRRRA